MVSAAAAVHHGRKKSKGEKRQVSGTLTMDGPMFDIAEWSPLQLALDAWLGSRPVEMLLGVIVATNLIFIVMETDASSPCAGEIGEPLESCHDEFLSVSNKVFLSIYTVEAGLRLYVERCQVYKDGWTMFDLFIVVTGYLDAVLSAIYRDLDVPGFTMLRALRLMRLLRVIRMLKAFPELHAMVRGFFSAMSAMFWGFFIILLLLTIWGCLAVEFIHPVNQGLLATAFKQGLTAEDVHSEPWCFQSFTSVSFVVLFFFQTLVAGDSWGKCSIPIIKAEPWTFIIFAGVFITIQLGFTNLILAVIVEKATEAHEDDIKREAQKRERQKRAAEEKMRRICSEIDGNGNGVVTFEELMQGYEENEEMRETLQVLDIDECDLQKLFLLMDVDRSGDLTYDEIVCCINKSDTMDVRRQIMFVKLQVETIANILQDKLNFLPTSFRAPGYKQVQGQESPPTSPKTIRSLLGPTLLSSRESPGRASPPHDVNGKKEADRQKEDTASTLQDPAPPASAKPTMEAKEKSMQPKAAHQVRMSDTATLQADIIKFHERMEEEFNILFRRVANRLVSMGSRTSADPGGSLPQGGQGREPMMGSAGLQAPPTVLSPKSVGVGSWPLLNAAGGLTGGVAEPYGSCGADGWDSPQSQWGMADKVGFLLEEPGGGAPSAHDRGREAASDRLPLSRSSAQPPLIRPPQAPNPPHV